MSRKRRTSSAWDPMRRSTTVVRAGVEFPVPDGIEIWGNRLYSAAVRRDEDGCAQLSVHRRDRRPLRDWRHMQRIKTEVLGADVEAVELYPAESRLMDGANEYHLWSLPPGERFPLGYTGERAVTAPEEAAHYGATQRRPDYDS